MLSFAISLILFQPTFETILVTGRLYPGTWRMTLGEAIAQLRRWTKIN
jgi:hypothetical protein